MFDVLSRGFQNAQLKLRGQARLTEENLAPALREVRTSLIQADVQLAVVQDFLGRVKAKALGEIVPVRDPTGRMVKITPQDHFVKACYDEMVSMMGPEPEALALPGKPTVIMMVGLQGSGKTTTTGKLAHMLLQQGRSPLLVAADIYRPAAVEQLMVIGRKLTVPVFSFKGMSPVDLARGGVSQARSVGRDVVIIDTAGRLAIDNALMQELVDIKAAVRPHEILFVADAMIGQDAVTTAKEFDRLLEFTGFVLTKMDGDARGGAALSIKAVTGKPVRFLGQGEELDKLEAFRPEGLAQRILGFGDVVGLMQDFERHVDKAEAERGSKAMLDGTFSYDDFQSNLGMIRRMGSLKELFARIPFLSGMLAQLPAEALDDSQLDRIGAIVQSMTKQERRYPDIINESRMERIADGCGREFDEVEALHQQFLQMRTMMKQFGGAMGGGGAAGGMAGMQRMMQQLGGGMPAPPKRERPRLSAEERRAKKAKRKNARKSRG
jgi:signal recognition particle subunit SRP54